MSAGPFVQMTFAQESNEMSERESRPTKVNRRRLTLATICGLLVLSLPVGVGLLFIDQYYSEKNLFMLNVPFAVSESDECTSLTVGYVLPKGVYRCFLVIVLNDFEKATLDANELLVNSNLYVSDEMVGTEEITIPMSRTLIDEYLSDYKEKREMYIRTGERALPHPWTYMEPEVAGDMKFPVGFLYLDSHGELGRIDMKLCGLNGLDPKKFKYFFRLERFIDAV